MYAMLVCLCVCNVHVWMCKSLYRWHSCFMHKHSTNNTKYARLLMQNAAQFTGITESKQQENTRSFCYKLTQKLPLNDYIIRAPGIVQCKLFLLHNSQWASWWYYIIFLCSFSWLKYENHSHFYAYSIDSYDAMLCVEMYFRERRVWVFV